MRLREISQDPHGLILRQNRATLGFSDEAELAQFRRLQEAVQIRIIAVLESLKRHLESSDYKLCQLSERNIGVLDELAAERKKMPQKENAELEPQLKSKLLGTQGSSFLASLTKRGHPIGTAKPRAFPSRVVSTKSMTVS